MNSTSAVIALVSTALDLPAGDLSAEASMESIPEWDSLAQLTICMRFQEEFGVTMDMDAIADATSIVKLVALLPH
jgi:acyl carrier protein